MAKPASSNKAGTSQMTSRADSPASRVPGRSGSRVVRPARTRPSSVPLRCLLKTNRADGNLLDVAILDQDGIEGDALVVARPPDQQAAFWSGNTIDGITYTANPLPDDREADDGSETENQFITPDYVADDSVLIVDSMPGGTGLTDPLNADARVVWQARADGRTWAAEVTSGPAP